MLLRLVPYIGPVVAAAFPAALAVAVDPGWAMLFWVVGLFLVIELITGYLIEPWLYGHSMGLSGVAVLVAAACGPVKGKSVGSSSSIIRS
jgi:predicted PurR-regulated permease PerM